MPSKRDSRSFWTREDERRPGELSLHEYTGVGIDRFHADGPPSDTDSKSEGSLPEFRFFSHLPIVRTLFRNANPLLLLLYLGLLFWFEVRTTYGASRLIPRLDSAEFMLVVLVCIAWGLFIVLIGYLFKDGLTGDPARERRSFWHELFELGRPLYFYVGLFILLTGAFFSAWEVATSNPGNVERNILHISGFFVTLYIGAPLVYDGILRTEQLFNHFADQAVVDVSDSDVDDPAEGLRPLYHDIRQVFDRSIRGIPVIPVMAVLLVLPYMVQWLLSDGPFNFNHPITLSIGVIADVIIVALAIQFIVVVRLLYTILQNDSPSLPDIRYRPFHEDEAAGFRDMGRFATRVNMLLILGAVYLAYRLFVQGRLDTLLRGDAFSLGSITPFWFISYLFPVVFYAAVVVVWIYFSFWLIHRTMEQGKKEELREVTDSSRRDASDYAKWQALRNGPVWPINERVLLALLSADLISLLISLPALVS
ncbi:MAG: hypothetical protein ABEJ71_01165 [Halodesulfurarchaeum sp.]